MQNSKDFAGSPTKENIRTNVELVSGYLNLTKFQKELKSVVGVSSFFKQYFNLWTKITTYVLK